MFRAFPYPYSSKMYSYFMIYYQSVAYKLKMAPFLSTVFNRFISSLTPRIRPKRKPRHSSPDTARPPFGGLVLRLAAVGCFVLVLSNRLCRRLPHLRFRDNQNHHCFAHRNRLLFIVAHVLGASAAASSFRNFVHLSRPPFVEYRFKACSQPFHPIPLLLLL